MSEQNGKKRSPLKTVLIVIIAILVVAAAAIGIYWFTGPYTPADAMIAKPLLGETANYEADGKLTVELKADGIGSLPAAEVPFKMTVAGNRTHLELFSGNADKAPLFETYIVPDGDGFKHYDKGNLSEVLSVLATLGYETGIDESSDVLVMLGLPDPSSFQLTTTDLAGAAQNAKLEKNDSGYDVVIAGSDLCAMLGNDGAEAPSGLIGEALSASEMKISYDKAHTPTKFVISDADATKSIDMGFFGSLKLNVESDLDGTFSRVGEVPAEETEVPTELQG